MVNKDIFNQSLLDAINKEYENNTITSTGQTVTYEKRN